MLEVEATGHPIHIQQFTHQIQPWLLAALHGGQVHLAQGDAARRDEFLAEYSALFARGLAAAALLYNPAVVVLGGGVSRVGKRLTDSLTASLSTELASWSHLTPRITTSRFDGDGVHLGARELARDVL